MNAFSKMILRVNCIALLCGVSLASQASEQRIVSPDGTVTVTVSDTAGLRYQVALDGQTLVKLSRLGLAFAGGVTLGTSARIEKAETTTRDGTWENRFGKRRTVRDRWNQVRLTLVEPGEPERRFGVIVRVYDDGVALRYDLPRESGLGAFVLERELTEFAFASDYRCWAGEPSTCAENQYPERTLSTIPERDKDGLYRSTLPLLVQAPACYVAVAESDVRDWAGMFVTGTGSPTVGMTLAPRGDGRGCVVSSVPRISPWRVLLLARTAGELVSSDLIATLATPSQLDDLSWIKPGLCAWDPWWTGTNATLPHYAGLWARGDTRAHKEYIDFAAEMGWPYQLVDWFWYENMTSYEITLNLGGKNPERPPVDFTACVPHVDIQALLAYAKQRNVRLMIWLHSYDLDRYGIERACELFSRWGAAGLKIDFMNSDSQETVAWYEKVIETAARHRLLVNFHGASKACGLARTWPNYITQEGVLGNEYNKLEGNRCTPLHMVTLPFTRGLLGPMDFTPGGFLNVSEAQFKITQPASVMGTRARQLAIPVIYNSPLTVLCDSPANYRGAAGIEFYRGLPTVWDDSVVPVAELAQHIVIARRSGDRWWLAAMNGSRALKLRVPLTFLGPGSWTLRSFADSPDAATDPKAVVEKFQSVTAGEALELELAPAGGYAAVLTRSKTFSTNGPPVQGAATLAVAPAPEGAPVSSRYAVRLREPGGEWKTAPVYAFFQQHDYNKALTTESQFATFESSGTVELEVTVTGAAKSPVLRPLRHGLAVKQEGAVLRFTMTDTTRQLCLELNDDPRHPLLLFSNPPEQNAPKQGDKRVTYFGPGYHKVKAIERPGYFEWAKGMTIYLAPGAVVESSLAISQNEGVTIRGRGILFTPHGEGKKPGVVPLKIDTSKNVRVEGIIVVSRADQWSIHVTKSKDVTFENFHLLSEIRDGLDILNSQEVFVRDSFIMAHDDALCLKGMWFGGGQPVEHIRVERCVLANMGGGNGIELGFEANAPVFRDVTFRNSDLIYSLPNGEKPDPAWPEGALTIHNHNTHGGVAACVRDVLYEDLRIEELHDDYLIDLHPLGGSTNSVIEGVTFRNIRQVGGCARPSRVMGRDNFPVENVVIENLEILGRRVKTLNDAGISTNKFVSRLSL